MLRTQRSTNTKPEVAVQRALGALGLTYVLQQRIDLPRWGGKHQHTTPDITFPTARLVIFVDGCQWHGCSDHFVDYKTNTALWREKSARARARDQRHNRALESLGYRVLRIRECEDPEQGAQVAFEILGMNPPPGTFQIGNNY